MEQDEKQSQEYVEAVPGPAIVITKDTYEKMKEKINKKHDEEKSEKYEKFFNEIKDETKLLEDDELTL